MANTQVMRAAVVNRHSAWLIVLLLAPVQFVASAECDDAADCPEVDQLEELQGALHGYREAIAIGDLGESEFLAKRVVELSIHLNGRDSVYSANALTNLAYVQYRQEQFETSRLNLLAAIRTIEETDGNLSANLIRPLHRLGETELALGEVGTAMVLFQRAVHISHVNNGPQNTEQIESLEAIAEISLETGDIKGASNIQEGILAYRARDAGPDSEDILPALEHYANWMHRLQLYNRERNTYFRILEIQENHHGRDDPSLVPTLILLAKSSREIGLLPFDDRNFRRGMGARHYLDRAMRIAENHPESDWELYADTALAVGDQYTRMRYIRDARIAYKKAWQQLSLESEGLAKREDELGSPKLLVTTLLPEYYEDGDPLFEPDSLEGFLQGSIVAEYDVNRWGEVVNIKLVETQPPGLARIEGRLTRTLKSMKHRPRMVGGAMVDTRRMTYVYEFSYRENGNQN